MTRPTILIADDSEAVVELLRSCLRPLDCEIVVAGDGEQALLRALVEDRLLGAGNRHDDRTPEIVAPGRFGDCAFLARHDLAVIDLLEDERRVSQGLPDPRWAALGAPHLRICLLYTSDAADE